ncbi:MAG: hypothetical protein ACOYMB_02945 [Patescibacteria group bacterium]
MATKNGQFAKNSTKTNKFGSGPSVENRSTLSKQEIAKQKISDSLEAKRLLKEAADILTTKLDSQMSNDLSLENSSGQLDGEAAVAAEKINQERETILDAGKQKITGAIKGWGSVFDKVAALYKKGVSKIIGAGRATVAYGDNGFEKPEDKNEGKKNVPFVKEKTNNIVEPLKVKPAKNLKEKPKKINADTQTETFKNEETVNSEEEVINQESISDNLPETVVNEEQMLTSVEELSVSEDFNEATMNLIAEQLEEDSAAEEMQQIIFDQQLVNQIMKAPLDSEKIYPSNPEDNALADSSTEELGAVENNFEEETAVIVSAIESPEEAAIVKNELEEEIDTLTLKKNLRKVNSFIKQCRAKIKIAETKDANGNYDEKSISENEELLKQLEVKKLDLTASINVAAQKELQTTKLLKKEQKLLNEIEICKENIKKGETKNEYGVYNEKMVLENEAILHQKESELQEVRDVMSGKNKPEVVETAEIKNTEVDKVEETESMLKDLEIENNLLETSKQEAQDLEDENEKIDFTIDNESQIFLNSPEEVVAKKLEALSAGQLKFVEEGLAQLYLEEIRSKAKEQFEQENSGSTVIGRFFRDKVNNYKRAQLEKQKTQLGEENGENVYDLARVNKEIERLSQAPEEKKDGPGWFKRMRRQMTKGYQIALLEKQNAEEHPFDSNKSLSHTEFLIDAVKGMGKDIVTKDGKLMIDFNTFDGLSENCRSVFDKFNEKASAFSALPKEYAFESARKGDKNNYEKKEEEYSSLRADLFHYLTAEKGEAAALAAISNIDSQVELRQFLTNNPDALKTIGKIGDKKYAIGRMLSSVWTENTAAFALGMGSRIVTKAGFSSAGVVGGSILQAGSMTAGCLALTVSMPVLATGFGAWRGRIRAAKEIREADIEARHQGAEKGQLEKERGDLLKKIQTLVPSEFSLDPEKWFDEIATQEEGMEYMRLRGEFDSLNKVFEKNKFGISRDQEGNITEIDKNIKANISQADSLTLKLNNLLDRLDQARYEGDEMKVKELEDSLQLRWSFTTRKLQEGLINFGAKEDRALKYLELNQALDKAEIGRYYSEHAAKVDKKLGTFLDHLKGKLADERTAYKNIAMVKGACLSTAFYVAGAETMRKLSGLYSGSVLEHAVDQSWGDIKEVVKSALPGSDNVLHATPVMAANGLKLSEVSNLYPESGIKPVGIPFSDPEVPAPALATPAAETIAAPENNLKEIIKPKVGAVVKEVKLPDTYDVNGNKIAFYDEKGNAILSDGRQISKEVLDGVNLPDDGGSVEALPDDPAPSNLQKVTLVDGVSGFKNIPVDLPDDGGSVEAVNVDDGLPQTMNNDGIVKVGGSLLEGEGSVTAIPDAANASVVAPKGLPAESNLSFKDYGIKLSEGTGDVTAIENEITTPSVNPVKPEIILPSTSAAELPETGDVNAVETLSSNISSDNAGEVLAIKPEIILPSDSSVELPETGDVNTVEALSSNISSDNAGEVLAIKPEIIQPAANLQDLPSSSEATVFDSNADLPKIISSDGVQVEAGLPLESAPGLVPNGLPAEPGANFKDYGIKLSEGTGEIILPNSETPVATVTPANQEVILPSANTTAPAENLPSASSVENDDDYYSADQEIPSNEVVKRVTEITNFDDISKNVAAANIKDQVTNGLFTNSKEFRSADSFMEQFKSLNKGAELSEAHQKAAQDIWAQWQSVKGLSPVYRNIISQKLNLLEKQILYNPLNKGK